ncbi:myb-like protein X isoform X2 [Condylostylus longicornis]|nr:myb-like protein X isoform X2 [Condylostylus longicornis]
MGSQDNSNPFDQIKQTCHNLFTSFTDKIAADLNLANQNKSSNRQENSAGTSRPDNVSDQPRVVRCEIPTYRSQNDQVSMNSEERDRRHSAKVPGRNSIVPNSNEASSFEDKSSKSNTASTTPSSPTSPLKSPSNSNSTHSLAQEAESNLTTVNEEQKEFGRKNSKDMPSIHKKSNLNNKKMFKNVFSTENCGDLNGSLIENGTNSANNSGCECSDDEIIASFKERKRKSENTLQNSGNELKSPEKVNLDNKEVNELSINSPQKCEDSSTSSFEELGAVGGSNLTPHDANLGNVSNDNEHWQIVGKDSEENVENLKENSKKTTSTENDTSSSIPKNNPSVHSSVTTLAVFNDRGLASVSPLDSIDVQRQRRILRRRSDGYIYNQNRANTAAALDMMYDVIQPDVGVHFPLPGRSNVNHIITNNMSPVDEESDNESEEQISITRKRLKKTCATCGKSKKNLKKQVLKFKKHLENSNITEEEIKQELDAFLEYLENRSKSFDGSEDSEGSNREFQIDLGTLGHRLAELHYEAAAAAALLGDDEGIHVYAHNEDDGPLITNGRYDNRFLNLNDFQTKEEIDELSVKQLKEILMLNRIDYKGCCEKHELLERVHRLWKDLQECPAVEKLPTDDLCKICMDAPIECVILECGHLATCTNCGKVLNECPICRQYIVRVVRFFRA